MSETKLEMIKGWISSNKAYISQCTRQIIELEATIKRTQENLAENEKIYSILTEAGIK